MHSQPPIKLGLAALLVALVLPLCRAFQVEPGSAPQHGAIVMSAWLAAGVWYIGAVMMATTPRDEHPETGIRLVWTAGCVLLLLHIAIAFHAAHGWSHDAAYRHTAEVGGFGAGVYVNYLFAALWLADSLWMWVAPDAYRRRPRWVGWAVHGFMAFIVFNATVVFGTHLFVRAVCLLFAAGLLWHLVKKWRTTGEPAARP